MGADQQAPGVRVGAREPRVVAHVGAGVHHVLGVARPRAGAHIAGGAEDTQVLLGGADALVAADRRSEREDGDGRRHDPAAGEPRERRPRQQAGRRDQLDEVVRPVGAAGEHADRAGREPRGDRGGEYAVAPQRPEPAQADHQQGEEARALAGGREPGDAHVQRQAGGRQRVQRVDAESEQRVGEAPGGDVGDRKPDRHARERDDRADGVGAGAAQLRAAFDQAVRDQEHGAREAGVEERLLDQDGTHREQPGGPQPADPSAPVRRDEAPERRARGDGGEQLAGCVDRAERHGAGEGGTRHRRDPRGPVAGDGARRERDAGHEREGGERAQHADAGGAADQREFVQRDQQRWAIEPVGTVERPVPAAPGLGDERDTALVDAERRVQVRQPQAQRERQRRGEDERGASALADPLGAAGGRRRGLQAVEQQHQPSRGTWRRLPSFRRRMRSSAARAPATAALSAAIHSAAATAGPTSEARLATVAAHTNAPETL